MCDEEVTNVIIPMLQMRRLRHREMEGWKGSGPSKSAAQQSAQFRPPALHSESAGAEAEGLLVSPGNSGSGARMQL